MTSDTETVVNGDDMPSDSDDDNGAPPAGPIPAIAAAPSRVRRPTLNMLGPAARRVAIQAIGEYRAKLITNAPLYRPAESDELATTIQVKVFEETGFTPSVAEHDIIHSLVSPSYFVY